MEIYVAQDVAEVDALHPYLTEHAFRMLPIRQQLGKQADVIRSAHASGDRRVRMHLMSWWPLARGKSLDDVMASPFGLEDAQVTMAREYGFSNWAEVEALGPAQVSQDFERALDVLLAGDIVRLQAYLEEAPHLTVEKSAYGHRATLLHYLGANGVETHRQRTPLNAVALAELLIARGADPNAKAHMYGGGQTPLALASTSAHPYKAGVSAELNRMLRTT